MAKAVTEAKQRVERQMSRFMASKHSYSAADAWRRGRGVEYP
ncbi:MAG: hypothetical protein AAF570_24545 [Bacteroidota bacterium]